MSMPNQSKTAQGTSVILQTDQGKIGQGEES